MKMYSLKTPGNGLVEITSQVRQAVSLCGVAEGMALVFVPHTTAGVAITSRMDELGLRDLEDEISRLVPTRVDFRHQFDTPTDAAGHIKSALVGNSVLVPVARGALALGSSQGIYFFEFDGPRERQFTVQVCAADRPSCDGRGPEGC